MTPHLFLTLALAVACVALAWGWWRAHRTLRGTEFLLSAFMGGEKARDAVTTGKFADNAVTDGRIAGPEDGVVFHFPPWMPDPPGPRIDHLGRELP